MQINTAAQQPTQSNTDTQSLSRHAGQRILADHTDQTEQEEIAPHDGNAIEQRKHSTQQNTSLANPRFPAWASSTNQNKPPATSCHVGINQPSTNTCFDVMQRTNTTERIARQPTLPGVGLEHQPE